MARARAVPGERVREGQLVTEVRREPPKEARREQGTEELRVRAREERPDRRPEALAATPAVARVQRSP